MQKERRGERTSDGAQLGCCERLFLPSHPVLSSVQPRRGAAGGGQHQSQLLGQQQTAGSRGAVEGGRLHLLPVCGFGTALHGHGLQAELPEPGQDPRRMLPFL